MLVRHLVRAQCPNQCGWTSQERRGGTRRRGGCRGCWQPPLNSHPPLTNPPTPHHTFNCPPQTLCPPSPQWGGSLERSWCGLTSISWSMLGVPLSPHCPLCILERAAPPKLPHSRHCADTNPVSQHHTQTLQQS